MKLAQALKSGNNIEFASDDLKRYIGIDGVRRNGQAFKRYLIGLVEKGITIRQCTDHMILEQKKDRFYFCSVGLLSRTPCLDDELNCIFDNIKKYEQMPDKKDALYRLRRDLAQVIKEASYTGEILEPFESKAWANTWRDRT